MAAGKPEPEVAAVQQVFEALKGMDAEGQQRVLTAALALLGLSFVGAPASAPVRAPLAGPTGVSAMGAPGRRKGLTELVNEKSPSTSSQRIVLFAYYRDKHEGLPTFSRADLRPYFAKAKLSPPSNYDRDFSNAVERGWIHEDGSESYITSNGEKLVESGFTGARGHSDSMPRERKAGRKKSPKRTKNASK